MRKVCPVVSAAGPCMGFANVFYDGVGMFFDDSFVGAVVFEVY